jgi:RNA polymerase sigma-70 factor (ECF subfamily)
MEQVLRLTQWLGDVAARALDAAADSGDWSLWRQACNGHAASATRLVRNLSPQAFGLAIQLVGRREDAEDIVQDAFLRLWRSKPSDTHGAKLSTYFNTIVINRCRSLLASRREQATEQAPLIQLHDEQQERDGNAGDAHDMTPLRRNGAGDRLSSGMARLPARQRMAIAMWAYADASVADIAHALELDPNAAHQLLHRAKQSLRLHLEGGAP